MPYALSPEQAYRYHRQVMLPEIGEAGQQRLLQAKVVLVGAGGNGSSAALYLAAAGVGKLGIVDFDTVDESNLQRQILHNVNRLGTPKTTSAKETLLALNPGVEIDAGNVRLCGENVEQVLSGYDAVIDGSDNYATRYLINDACVKLGLPDVHGSVCRLEGQVTVFHPPRGPCYRCLYPEAPPADLPTSRVDSAVLGVLPGVVGVMQAAETLKLILQIGDPLIGRLLHFDALEAEFRALSVHRDPDCGCCANS